MCPSGPLLKMPLQWMPREGDSVPANPHLEFQPVPGDAGRCVPKPFDQPGLKEEREEPCG